jgi:hypothetical protein
VGKKQLIRVLKIVLPLMFGVFLVWYFYDKLSAADRKNLYNAFAQANYLWVIVGLIPGFLAILSRAWRWRYMLDAMGFRIPFWGSYHAIMIGYLINYALPRAGEASRAGLITHYYKVPFARGFGTIMAERIIDLVMLGVITLLAVFLLQDRLDLFEERLGLFQREIGGSEGGGIDLGMIVIILVGTAIVASVVMAIIRPSFRQKLRELFRGMMDGLLSVFHMNRKWEYLLHTVFIWVAYVLMFIIPFEALESTSTVPFDGRLAGFIAGTVGIVAVQGGIGVYPAFVGMIISVYLSGDSGQLIHPQAMAMGWIIWTSQTVMMVALGGISLLLMPRKQSQQHVAH